MYLFSKEDLAVYINNQLQTAVGKILMEQFRLRIEGLKVSSSSQLSMDLSEILHFLSSIFICNYNSWRRKFNYFKKL